MRLAQTPKHSDFSVPPYIGTSIESAEVIGIGADLKRIVASTLSAREHEAESYQGSVKQRFEMLSRQWKTELKNSSSVTEVSRHPAYREIVAFGEVAIPLILRDLDRSPEHWFPALLELTQQDPVPPEDRGRIRKMTNAWIMWGHERKLL